MHDSGSRASSQQVPTPQSGAGVQRREQHATHTQPLRVDNPPANDNADASTDQVIAASTVGAEAAVSAAPEHPPPPPLRSLQSDEPIGAVLNAITFVPVLPSGQLLGVTLTETHTREQPGTLHTSGMEAATQQQSANVASGTSTSRRLPVQALSESRVNAPQAQQQRRSFSRARVRVLAGSVAVSHDQSDELRDVGSSGSNAFAGAGWCRHARGCGGV